MPRHGKGDKKESGRKTGRIWNDKGFIIRIYLLRNFGFKILERDNAEIIIRKATEVGNIIPANLTDPKKLILKNKNI